MMIGSELFRQAPRTKAMAVAGVVNWVATFMIALGFQTVQVSKIALHNEWFVGIFGNKWRCYCVY